MSSPFVAEIKMFAGNFAPSGWALCNGQILPISQNTALFSLIGTYYGGDGRSTSEGQAGDIQDRGSWEAVGPRTTPCQELKGPDMGLPFPMVVRARSED